MFRPEQTRIMAGLLAYSFSGRLPIVFSEVLLTTGKFSKGESFSFAFEEFDSGRVALKYMENTAAGTAREFNPVPYYPIFRMKDQNHNQDKYIKEFKLNTIITLYTFQHGNK